MPRLKKQKIAPIKPGEDGLVLVEVVKSRLERKAGRKYKVDPIRAAKLLQLGWVRFPGKEADNG
jgi:hypothetical protein